MLRMFESMSRLHSQSQNSNEQPGRSGKDVMLRPLRCMATKTDKENLHIEEDSTYMYTDKHACTAIPESARSLTDCMISHDIIPAVL